MASQLTHEQWKRIDDELGASRTIEAIKLYREYTGEGLKEAKDAIDARKAQGSGGDAPGGQKMLKLEQEKQVDELIFAGQMIQAIKLYRDLTGTDLKGAKDAVEARREELRRKYPGRLAQKGGCLSVLLLLLVPAAVAGYALARALG